MSDGNITFSTKLDNAQLEKELKDTERKIAQSREKITKAEEAKLPLVKKLEEMQQAMEEARKSVSYLKEEIAGMEEAMRPGSAPDDYFAAAGDLPQARQTLEEQQKKLAQLQAEWDKIRDKVAGYDAKIEQATAELERNKAAAGHMKKKMSSGGAQMAKAMDKARTAAKKLETRLLSIAKSALLFSVMYTAFRKVAEYMGKALKTNAAYTKELARLLGALYTAFQPLYEFILPGLLAVLRVLTAVVQVTANILSKLSGKTAAQSADAAKQLYNEANALDEVSEAARRAQRQTAGFDEMNIMQSNDASAQSGTTVAPDFTDFDTEAYKSKIDELTVYISGAFLALGALLAFSGVNIPLGIALLAAGAAGLVVTIKENWHSMDGSLKEAVNWVTVILGGALLVIGAILAFSGVSVAKGITLIAMGAVSLGTAAALNWDTISNALQTPMGKTLASLSLLVLGVILTFTGVATPLGVSLMAAGATGLVTVTALNWNTIVSALRGPVGAITALISGSLLVFGILLVCTGVALPLGIALIAAGAAGLVTVTALNWNAILEKLKGVWGGIQAWWKQSVAPKLTLKYWKEKFSSIGEGLAQKIKDGINTAIRLINQFIGWLNEKMNFSWDAFKIAGKTIIPKGSLQLFTIPKIPYLAQGAVIPPNREFMAVLGDQKHGTNLEAPEDLIRKIVREESGGGGADRPIVFVLKIGKRTLGKAVVDSLNELTRQEGELVLELG